MLDALVGLMDAATGQVAYADARHVRRREERLTVRLGRVEGAEDDEAEGIGVRVRVGAGWGFAATRDTSRAGAERALAQAIAIAVAQPAGAGAPRTLAPLAPQRGTWSATWSIDPFEVALEDKLGLLLAADAALREGADPRLVSTEATARAMRQDSAFASTEGSAVEQRHVFCGGGIQALAVHDGELQGRSWPGRHEGGVVAAGWERMAELELVGHAPRVTAEALELLTAPPCPEGRFDVVLHGEQLALQVHESVGHALELDRILGGEASYAGTSWVRPDDLGALAYGSPHMHVTADATLPRGLGSFGWDDEGVPGQRFDLVREGRLQAALSSRESAAATGRHRSGGCMRADGFDRQPIVRMTNVSLEPGTAGSLADLLADTGDGLYLETNTSWSIDDRRLHFQFGCEVAREIRGGELGRLYRNPTYAGVTPHFWASLDAVCGRGAWEPWGTMNCGKGEPGQLMQVSHGAAPARFRGVQVGVA